MILNVQVINIILIGLIISIVAISSYLFFFILNKKKPEELVTEINNKVTQNFNTTPTTNLKKSRKRNKKLSDENADNNPQHKPANILMDFDRIVDDMIIKNNGSLCAMIIQCQGISLDLMSESERASVEQAFIDFINSLNMPIQIYIQTRTVEYKDNLFSYENRIKTIENQLREMVDQFNRLQLDPSTDKKLLAEMIIDIQRKQQYYQYAKHLKKQVEKMSKNNVVKNSNYYIIISSSAQNLGISSNFKKNNTLIAANSKLFEECKNIINSLNKCGIESSILNSYQITELLSNAFYQSTDEVLKLRQSLDNGLFKLYSTSK